MRTFKLSFLPMAMEMQELAPVPTMLPRAERIVVIGIHKERAVTLNLSPVCPMKYISAILYMTITKIVITAGIHILAINFQIDSLAKISCPYNFFFSSISPTSFNYTNV